MNDAFDALNALDPGMPREEWVRICFACVDAGVTLEEWLSWCERGANFNKADAVSTYRNAKPREGGVSQATLYMKAREAGWTPNGAPRPVPAPAPRPKVEEPPPTDPGPVWDACSPVDVHGYLTRKRIKAHGARVSSAGWLVVPYYNRERALQTVQSISADGTKRFLAGARQKGSVAILGEPQGAPVIVIAEGFATAAAIEEATSFVTLAAGSRVSFPEAARIARHFAPNARVVIAADRGDLSTPIAAARGVAGFLALPGPEDSADGFDFADWRLNGATDAEIRARIEHAQPIPQGDDERPTEPRSPPQVATKRAQLATAKADAPAAGAYMVDGKGHVIANLRNATAWLAAGNLGKFRVDTFTGLMTWDGEPIREVHYGSITCEMQAARIDGGTPFARVAVSTVVDAIAQAAEVNAFNSCVDWLDSLPPWDNVERIGRFFADVTGCDASDYVMGVSRYFWLGMVARMVQPGTKVDSAVVLVGAQGIGKSTLGRIVAGERFGEVGLAHIGERDWCMQLRGKILIEIAELSGHSRAELETIKAVLTRTADDYRAPYAHSSQSVPRGCVFMGTTNEFEFLLDQGGNRRWLPLNCPGGFDLDAVAALRDACFAEAYAQVRAGLGPLWHVVPGAVEQQAAHVARDPWIDTLDEKLRDNIGTGDLIAQISNVEIYRRLDIPPERRTGGGTGRRIVAAMRQLGYVPTRLREGPRIVRGFSREQHPTL